jgi:hypothetical protein
VKPRKAVEAVHPHSLAPEPYSTSGGFGRGVGVRRSRILTTLRVALALLLETQICSVGRHAGHIWSERKGNTPHDSKVPFWS